MSPENSYESGGAAISISAFIEHRVFTFKGMFLIFTPSSSQGHAFDL
jgi:hypothetical protein